MNYILIFQYDNFEYIDKNYINIWKWNFLNKYWKDSILIIVDAVPIIEQFFF